LHSENYYYSDTYLTRFRHGGLIPGLYENFQVE
jgi:hypothetical protein